MSLSPAQFDRAAALEAGQQRVRDLERMTAPEVRRLLNGDPAEALPWVRSAAEHGMPAAQVRLGHMLLEGLGVTRDQPAGFSWFERAAAQNDADALNMVGRCYENGWGVEVNLEQAVTHYHAAAQAGLDWGEYNYAHMLFDGRGIEQDRRQALLWYGKAANRGHGRAMNLVARCLEEGWGCAPSPEDAAYWYRRSAETGYFRAQFNHALILLQNGQRAEAIEWLQKASAGGDSNMKQAVSAVLSTLS